MRRRRDTLSFIFFSKGEKMSHTDSLKNVPDINSKEFENFLKENGFKTDYVTNTKNTFAVHENTPNNSSPEVTMKNEGKSFDKWLFEKVNNWCKNNPIQTIAILSGGMAFLSYKMAVRTISQGVFKGNLKTSRYYEKLMNY